MLHLARTHTGSTSRTAPPALEPPLLPSRALLIAAGAPAPGPPASACETAISYDCVSSAMPSVADQQLPDPCCVIGSRTTPGSLGPPPPSAGDALFALMNNPHPLDILADASAYGSAGKISRVSKGRGAGVGAGG